MFPPDQKWFGGFFLSVKELSAFKFSMTFSLYIERGKMSRKYYEKKRKKRRAILIAAGVLLLLFCGLTFWFLHGTVKDR